MKGKSRFSGNVSEFCIKNLTFLTFSQTFFAGMATDTTRGSSGVSFGFSKVIQKSKVVKTDTNKKTFEGNDDGRPQETDFVKEVNERDGVKGSIVREVKKELVIDRAMINPEEPARNGGISMDERFYSIGNFGQYWKDMKFE